MKLGDFAAQILTGIGLQTGGEFDRLRPVAHHLRQRQPMAQCRGRIPRALEAVERGLSPIAPTGTQEVLAQFEHRVLALGGIQVAPVGQILVHTDGAIGFAASTEQIAQREVQLDRFRVQPHHVDERVDRLVGLLVEQEVQAAEGGVGELSADARWTSADGPPGEDVGLDLFGMDPMMMDPALAGGRR